MFAQPVSAIAAVFVVISSAGAMSTAIAQANQMPLGGSRSSLQLAQAPSRPRPDEAQWLRELNLNANQMRQIQAIRQQYQSQLNQERQALQQASQELRQLMTTNASADQIRQKFTQVQTLRQKLANTRLDSMLAIRTVLNPQQRQKLGELMGRKNKQLRDWASDRNF